MLLNRREEKPARRTADLPLNAVFAIAQIAAFLCMIVMQCLNAAAEKVVFLILSLALWGVMSPGLLSRSGPLRAVRERDARPRANNIRRRRDAVLPAPRVLYSVFCLRLSKSPASYKAGLFSSTIWKTTR